jgi:hypothetical protein
VHAASALVHIEFVPVHTGSVPVHSESAPVAYSPVRRLEFPMNPSYLRLRLPIAEALKRFSGWIGYPQLGPPRKVKSSKVVDAACKNGYWRSVVAVFIYESEDWTVFDDQTGHLASVSKEQWRSLARQDELVFAGYNDSVPYGQIIVVRFGRVVREFLKDQQDPRSNVNRGKLPFESNSPMKSWIDAASFVDEDEIVTYPDTGLLWMFGDLSKPAGKKKPGK